MTYFGGYKTAVLALVVAISAQAFFFGTLLWLSVWTGAYDQHGVINTSFYLGVYALILFGYEICFAVHLLIFQYGSLKAASTLHRQLVEAIMSVHMRWFDHQPMGTIINRFSKDMQSLDTILVDWVQRTVEAVVRLTFRIVSIASIMPVFAIPTFFLCSFAVFVGEIYIRASGSIKRLVSSTQSPLFAHFSDTLTGMTTIRAQKDLKDVYKHILADRLRDNAKALEGLYNTNR